MDRLTLSNFNDGIADTGNGGRAPDMEVSQWRGNTQAGNNVRISSKIFSQARNFRMNQIYKYDENFEWNFDNTFEYKTKFILAMMEDGVEDILPADTMLRFIPEPEDLIYVSGATTQRLVYYSQDYDFENNELQAIMEFKIWSLTNGLKLP